MGLFKKNLSEAEQIELADMVIEEARNLLQSSPKKALKLINKRSKELYDLLTFGGKKHDNFKELMIEIWARSDNSKIINSLPGIYTVNFEKWKNPTIGDLYNFSREIRENILYCKWSGKLGFYNPVVELNMLKSFAVDERVVLGVISNNLMIKKSFLSEAGTVLDPKIEEIGQELSDFAKKTDKKVIFF